MTSHDKGQIVLMYLLGTMQEATKICWKRFQDSQISNQFILQKVFCGHEYTKRNLTFALMVKPENEKVREMLSWAKVNLCMYAQCHKNVLIINLQ